MEFERKLRGRSWCTPSFIVACLIIGNAALITTVVIVGIYFGKEVNYRSEKEFLLQLQRIYDVAIYSLFSVVMFYIITSSVGLAMQLKVMEDSVNYITQQVNQQRQECEESVRRFVRDAFFVRKYYEDGLATFKPAEVLSVQQAVSKYKEMKKERNVDETIREISKHLTMLNKTKFITDQPDEKQFDSKFTKIIEELSRTAQTTVQKNASRMIQTLNSKNIDINEAERLRTQEELGEMLKGSQVGEKGKYADLTQRNIKGENGLVTVEKTQISVIETTTDQITAMTSEHKKSILSQKSRKFRSPSSKMASKISRTIEAEETQSSSYRTIQRDVDQASTENESDVKMTKLSKSFKSALSMSETDDRSLRKSEE